MYGAQATPTKNMPKIKGTKYSNNINSIRNNIFSGSSRQTEIAQTNVTHLNPTNTTQPANDLTEIKQVTETSSTRSQKSINSDWPHEISSLEVTSSLYGVYKLDSQTASTSAYRDYLVLWLLIKGIYVYDFRAYRLNLYHNVHLCDGLC